MRQLPCRYIYLKQNSHRLNKPIKLANIYCSNYDQIAYGTGKLACKTCILAQEDLRHTGIKVLICHACDCATTTESYNFQEMKLNKILLHLQFCVLVS